MFRGALLVLLAAWAAAAAAQTPGRTTAISGTVVDASTGESLIGASVLCLDRAATGTTTNAYGTFNLLLDGGCTQVAVRFIGYVTDTLRLPLPAGPVRVELRPVTLDLGTAEVVAEGATALERASRLGSVELRPSEVRAIPQLFGERDVIKAIQLLPGVQATSEGGSGFYVRGGGADQNLVLLDEAPVYNPSHLLGFFSIFNGDAINSAELYKSGIPARYGGRASSVLDVRMKDGNAKKLTAYGGIGLISSRLTIEAPVAAGRGSLLVSGRRTYADLFLLLSKEEALQNTDLYFYDLNAKFSYRLNDRHRVFGSFYGGRDDFDFSDNFLLRWGNRTGTVRWNALWSDRLFGNTSVIWSDFAYRLGFGNEEFGFFRDAGIRDVQIKEDLTWYAHPDHTVRGGYQGILHTFTDEVSFAAGSNGTTFDSAPRRVALESAVYLEDTWTVGPRWKALVGLRYARFDLVDGPLYRLNAERELDGDVEDMPSAADGAYGQGGFEPRVAVEGALTERLGLKLSAERNRQYLHQVSNTSAGNPTDLWMPASNNIAPIVADQISLDFTSGSLDGAFTWTLGGYYKQLDDVLEFKSGADVFAPTTLESEVIAGSGEAYGAEVLLRRTSGAVTGWISYTLSRSFRTFAQVDGGVRFPAPSDRIHNAAVVVMWEVSPRAVLSANWVYHTGDPATFPSGFYYFDGRLVPQYTERNAGRFPAYHRLDVGVTLRRGAKPAARAWANGEWNFSVYNAYGRENTYLIDFRESETDPGRIDPVSIALFKWVPSVSYDFRF
jgi:hypothetical protein